MGSIASCQTAFLIGLERTKDFLEAFKMCDRQWGKDYNLSKGKGLPCRLGLQSRQIEHKQDIVVALWLVLWCVQQGLVLFLSAYSI